jgi:hypothetical protein
MTFLDSTGVVIISSSISYVGTSICSGITVSYCSTTYSVGGGGFGRLLIIISSVTIP